MLIEGEGVELVGMKITSFDKIREVCGAGKFFPVIMLCCFFKGFVKNSLNPETQPFCNLHVVGLFFDELFV